LLYFGMSYLYPWTHPNIIATSGIIKTKTFYLNIPFFFIRLILFFSVWILLTRMIRKVSLQEDETGGMGPFHKIEWYSRVLIFFLALSFSLMGFDLLMSIDVNWYSTI